MREKITATATSTESILQIYGALTEAMKIGQPYQSLLDPPRADPSSCQPPCKH